ncbi:sodium-dependent phosphate cotransporter [Roseivirga ehrenbergii]|nr:sodium-dependent phosphate cotransporter [Roseivirga ehrenbergii]
MRLSKDVKETGILNNMKEVTFEESIFSSIVAKVTLIILAVLFFLVSIDLVITALSGSLNFINENLLSNALNPFVGLFLGLLVTAIIQSSSTTSTMVVALVASGTLSLEEAVPIIMGANVGTTLTSTIVALGFISNKRAFRRAVAVGTIHDFYNIILVLILFPLEHYYGFLSGVSFYFSELLYGSGISEALPHTDNVLGSGLTNQFVLWVNNSVLILVISFAFLFASIKLLSWIIKKTIIGESKNRLQSFVFDKPLKSFSWGVLLTAAVQSSSVTTSIIVPLAAADKIKLRNAFTFIIGANVGTTLTALIAAGFRSEAAATIAIAHLLFNLTGVVIFMSLPILRKLLVHFVKEFSYAVAKYRVIGLAYIIIMFFLLPFLLISLNRNVDRPVNKKHETTVSQRF